MSYFPALHGIRGLAALSVLLFHWHGSFPSFANHFGVFHALGTDWDLFFFVKLGWIGVDWFFVLSGFLLATTLWNREIKLKLVFWFWVKRVARLYPGLWVHLILLLSFIYLYGFLLSVDVDRVIGNFLLWVDPMPYGVERLNAVLWTLPLELCFYLSLPFWVLLYRKTGIVAVFIIALFATLLWRFGVIFLVDSGFLSISLSYVRYSIFGLFFVFMCGFFIAYLNSENKIVIASSSRFNLLIFFMILYVAWFYVLVDRRAFAPRTDWLLTIWELIAALIISGILGALLKPVNGFGWLAARPLQVLGDLSFGIYLWHFPIFRIMHRLKPDYFATPQGSLAALGIGLALSIIMAWLSYRFIERPAIDWVAKKSSKSFA